MDWVVCPAKKKIKSKTYVVETAQLAKDFFKIYDVEEEIAFSDNGNSFKEDVKHLLEGLGVQIALILSC